METLDAIRTRKSIRRFNPTPVPQEDIVAMLEAATMAPSGANRQPWRFIVVKSEQRKREMVACIKKSCFELKSLLRGVVENPEETAEALKKRFRLVSLFFGSAPVVFVVLMEREDSPFLKCYTNQGMDELEAFRQFGYVNILSVSAAIENLLLAAHDLGYGACWMNIPFVAKDSLEMLFDVEDPWELLAMIPVGKPSHNPRSPPRKRVEDVTLTIDD
ncbi:MAG: nitroreductase family protein [Theionarchaea archaeon]|nr:nitroreductase family protein [Theionarchaea archaeon]MBU7037895.1 nitroreductase family protein [Theionarchaea archaeon]